MPLDLYYKKVAFLFCPTGDYCREDRCQSFFKFSLIPSRRAPLEEAESAGAIKACGGTAAMSDAPALNLNDAEFIKRIELLQADLLIIVTTFGSLDQDLAWAKRFRELWPAVVIGLRGTPSYVDAERILKSCSAINFCIRGEYELFFKELLTRGYRDAAGAIYLDQGQLTTVRSPLICENLDDLPLPDRSI